MTDLIDINKKYRTKDKYEAVIYTINAGGLYPVHGAYRISGNENWKMCQWTARGSYHGDQAYNPSDLVEIKPRRIWERWVNVYSGERCSVHFSRELAERDSGVTRTECLHIVHEYEEGEGI